MRLQAIFFAMFIALALVALVGCSGMWDSNTGGVTLSGPGECGDRDNARMSGKGDCDRDQAGKGRGDDRSCDRSKQGNCDRSKGSRDCAPARDSRSCRPPCGQSGERCSRGGSRSSSKGGGCEKGGKADRQRPGDGKDCGERKGDGQPPKEGGGCQKGGENPRTEPGNHPNDPPGREPKGTDPEPTKPGCRSDRDCEKDSICREGLCLPECSKSCQCPEGLACEDGVCRKPKLEPQKQCKSICDCTSGEKCVDGYCKKID